MIPFIAAGLAALLFLQGWIRLRRRGRPDLAGWNRLVLFGSGLGITLFALIGPLDRLADEKLLSAHMGQHVLIGDLGPALMVTALRGPLLVFFLPAAILAPLARSLAPGGRLLVVQSYGHDPGAEVVRRLWPNENTFPVGRGELLAALHDELGAAAGDYDLTDPPGDAALFRYEMHTLPSEISDRIGTSTLFAAWNAVIYVNQIEDERLDDVVSSGAYLQATQQALHDHGGLWFNDEAFVVTRR